MEDLRKLEESLWRPETRFDREYMDGVLHEEFFEFGRSGRKYSREESLSAEEVEFSADLKDFKVQEVAEGVALVTYISEAKYGEALEVGNRSSLWVKVGDEWKLRFHQGTVV